MSYLIGQIQSLILTFVFALIAIHFTIGFDTFFQLINEFQTSFNQFQEAMRVLRDFRGIGF